MPLLYSDKPLEPCLIGDFTRDEYCDVIVENLLVIENGNLTPYQAEFIEFYKRAFDVLRLVVAEVWNSGADQLKLRVLIAFCSGNKCNGAAKQILSKSKTPSYLAVIEAEAVPILAVNAFRIIHTVQPILSKPPYNISNDSQAYAIIASNVAVNAVMLLALHEIGHCVRSHLPLWQSLFGLSVISENQITGRRSHIRRALETDADDFAAVQFGIMLRSVFKSEFYWTKSIAVVELVAYLSAVTLAVSLSKSCNSETVIYHSPFSRAMHITAQSIHQIERSRTLGFLHMAQIMALINKSLSDQPESGDFVPEGLPPSMDSRSLHLQTTKNVIRLRNLGLIKHAL